jgi:hypothetical protein
VGILESRRVKLVAAGIIFDPEFTVDFKFSLLLLNFNLLILNDQSSLSFFYYSSISAAYSFKILSLCIDTSLKARLRLAILTSSLKVLAIMILLVKFFTFSCKISRSSASTFLM